MKRWEDPISARREIEELFRKEHVPRTDGGDFTLDDYLHQLRVSSRLGIELSQWAEAAGVSVEFAQTLKAYLVQFPGERP